MIVFLYCYKMRTLVAGSANAAWWRAAGLQRGPQTASCTWWAMVMGQEQRCLLPRSPHHHLPESSPRQAGLQQHCRARWPMPEVTHLLSYGICGYCGYVQATCGAGVLGIHKQCLLRPNHVADTPWIRLTGAHW